jgi:RNA polymerase sigma-70 factor (ECF subfamily)
VPAVAPAWDPASHAEVRAALAALSPRQREAVLLVEVLGLRYREAAEVLGVPIGTVKSRVFQARERLVAWMNADEGSAGAL